MHRSDVGLFLARIAVVLELAASAPRSPGGADRRYSERVWKSFGMPHSVAWGLAPVSLQRPQGARLHGVVMSPGFPNTLSEGRILSVHLPGAGFLEKVHMQVRKGFAKHSDEMAQSGKLA